jgi:hypothetical protein
VQYGSRLLMVGGSLSGSDIAQLAEAGIKLLPISRGRTQSVYRIDSTSVILSRKFAGIVMNTICFDLESFSDDQSWFLSGNEKLAAGNSLFKGLAHSGNYSSRLSGKDLYGLPYQIRNIAAGQVYRVSIWRKGDEINTFLVAATENTGQFYMQSAEYIDGTKGSWNKISLEFSVPANLTAGYIKIYVWNNSGMDAYFDDLTLQRLK